MNPIPSRRPQAISGVTFLDALGSKLFCQIPQRLMDLFSGYRICEHSHRRCWLVIGELVSHVCLKRVIYVFFGGGMHVAVNRVGARVFDGRCSGR